MRPYEEGQAIANLQDEVRDVERATQTLRKDLTNLGEALVRVEKNVSGIALSTLNTNVRVNVERLEEALDGAETERAHVRIDDLKDWVESIHLMLTNHVADGLAAKAKLGVGIGWTREQVLELVRAARQVCDLGGDYHRRLEKTLKPFEEAIRG